MAYNPGSEYEEHQGVIYLAVSRLQLSLPNGMGYSNVAYRRSSAP